MEDTYVLSTAYGLAIFLGLVICVYFYLDRKYNLMFPELPGLNILGICYLVMFIDSYPDVIISPKVVFLSVLGLIVIPIIAMLICFFAIDYPGYCVVGTLCLLIVLSACFNLDKSQYSNGEKTSSKQDVKLCSRCHTKLKFVDMSDGKVYYHCDMCGRDFAFDVKDTNIENH